MLKEIAIVGAGFSGAVVAHGLAETGKYHITVFDERSHIAGNCHTVREEQTGILVHQYGPHIFHTDREDVWKYVNRYSAFGPYVNRVKAHTKKGVFSLPLNLLTINQFFNKTFNPDEAAQFIGSLGDQTIEKPQSFEDQALKFVGKDLYKNFFYGYTKKQWGVEPSELPASILKRLPVRFNYDDNYYSSKYQGIPVEGYTHIIAKILSHPAISVKLKSPFVKKDTSYFDHTFYSGAMDVYFDHCFGRLEYRTLVFKPFTKKGDFQGNAVINYCEEEVPYTRITEHKHFAPWEKHTHTVCFREYSKRTEPGDVPYYPMRLAKDKKLLVQYAETARKEEKITFIGRLGTYRYLDMHMVIGESLDLVEKCKTIPMHYWPKFSSEELSQQAYKGAA